MAKALIVDACRTPRAIGKPGKGAYAGILPQHLAATVLQAIVERSHVDSADIDDVIWGVSAQAGTQAGDMGRMAALDAGYSVLASGTTLDRFCGSGLTAVSFGAAQIMAGMEDLVVAGGTEMMSVITEIMAKGPPVPHLMDGGNLRLRARHPQSNQGLCADAIATMEGIGRVELDTIALASQRRADVAIREGRFDRSLVPVYREDGTLVLDREEYPRPSTTSETLAGLPPAFAHIADYPLDAAELTYRKLIASRYPDIDIEFVHHAGNSSGVVDGAAAILLASRYYVERHGLTARARIVATANMGDDPTLMLNGPVPATRKVLAKAGLTIDDIDLFEVNEAFAVVVAKYMRDLGVAHEKINVNGGAIALGHPIGATGAILIGTLLDELERRDLKRGLITMCSAGGMAPAMIIERI